MFRFENVVAISNAIKSHPVFWTLIPIKGGQKVKNTRARRSERCFPHNFFFLTWQFVTINIWVGNWHPTASSPMSQTPHVISGNFCVCIPTLLRISYGAYTATLPTVSQVFGSCTIPRIDATSATRLLDIGLSLHPSNWSGAMKTHKRHRQLSYHGRVKKSIG
jgi:hypothetical protein